MADANTELKEIAVQVANELQSRELSLRKQICDAQLHIAQLEAQLQASSVARDRSFNFAPTLDGNFQCPHCWVRQGNRNSLRPINSPNSNDYYVCPSCNTEFVIEQ